MRKFGTFTVNFFWFKLYPTVKPDFFCAYVINIFGREWEIKDRKIKVVFLT